MSDALKSCFTKLASLENEAAANGYAVTSGEVPHKIVSEAILQRIEPGQNLSLLDIGCGTGEILRSVSPYFARATGLDIVPEMADRARAKGLDVRSYDGQRIPFEDGRFDRILIYQVLVNFPSIRLANGFLFEAFRVLSPGGLMFIGAIPHPKWSPFPSHNSLAKLRHTISSAVGRSPLSCFAFPPSFFSTFATEVGSPRFEMHRNPVPLQGWAQKYDVLITKSEN